MMEDEWSLLAALAMVILGLIVIFGLVIHASREAARDNNEKSVRIQIACIEQGGSFANGTCLWGGKP